MTTNKNYFVIGLSGITNGGKTTLSHLLQRSFPWCRVIYQDAYFYDDDSPNHVRVPHVENHVNYEIITALDMKRMEQDIRNILEKPITRPIGNSGDGGQGDGDLTQEEKVKAPNFEKSGEQLINSVHDIDFDTSKYRNVPILLLEGFLLFESEYIYNICDTRFFLTLTEEECRERRSKRTTYVPPDCPGYFDACIWPEYIRHVNNYISNRPPKSIHVIPGGGEKSITTIWKESLVCITNEIEKKFPNLVISANGAENM